MIRKLLMLTALVTVPVVGGSASAKAEEYCREYTKTVSVGGQWERAYGTACYRPDGSWEIVSTQGSDYGRAQVRDVIIRDVGKIYQPTPSYNVKVVEHRYVPTYKTKYYRSHYVPYVLKHAYYNKKHKNKHHHKHDKYDKKRHKH